MLKKEWKNLFKNKFLIVALIAIMTIPTIYTTLFLNSMWDPYGKVENLPVAIVNKDIPVTYEETDKRVNVGEKLVDKLKDDDSLAFNFVDEKTALEGLENGTYYMVITVPEDFSANAITLLDKKPKKMILEYATNPGKNYIASKMSDSALTKIKNSVSNTVSENYAETVFEQFDEIGESLTEAADGSLELKDGLAKLEDGGNKLTDGLSTLSDSMGTFTNGAGTLSEGLNTYLAGVETVDGASKALYDGSSQLAAGAGTLSEGLNTYLDGVGTVDGASNALYNGSNQLVAGAGSLSQGLNSYLDGASTVDAASKELAAGVDKLAAGANELNSKVQGISLPTIELSKEQKETLQNTAASGTAEYANQLSAGIGSAVSGNIVSTLTSDNTVGAVSQQILADDNIAQMVGALQSVGYSKEQAEALVVGIISNTLKGVSSNITADSITNAISPTVSSTVGQIAGGAAEKGALAVVDQVNSNLASYGEMFTALKDGTKTLSDGLNTLNAGTSQLKDGTSQLVANNSALKDGMNSLSGGLNTLNAGTSQLKDGTSQLVANNSTLKNGMNSLSDGLNTLNAGTSQLKDGTSQLVANNPALKDGVNSLSDGANKISSGVNQLYDGSITLSDGLKTAGEGTEKLEDGLSEGADKLKDKLKFVTASTSEMFGSPVDSEKTELTELPNNGHAMAAYMMVVALWVACMGFCSVYPITKQKGQIKSGFRLWFSKATIMFPTIVLAAGGMLAALMHFNDFDPANLSGTMLVAAVAGITFMSMLYFLNSAFGVVGRFIGFVLMVVQLSGCTGTYPVELSGEFVEKITNYLPFTHVVKAFRETIVGGNNIESHLIFLGCVALVCTILTIAFFELKVRMGHAQDFMEDDFEDQAA